VSQDVQNLLGVRNIETIGIEYNGMADADSQSFQFFAKLRSLWESAGLGPFPRDAGPSEPS
jgi:hypothetical protein